ncbi:MAG TPA: IS110 family transposase [Gemmataceae bacterium]|nr:IS110 family transposase [Gemmataceae bacterium]
MHPNTNPNTAVANTTIVAIDLGKYQSVACLYSGDPTQARFVTVTTDRNHLRQLFAKHRPGAVVIEACLLAGWVHDLCHELGLACHVANTASEAWKFQHTKRKTDKDDALRLAQLFALGQLPTVTVPPPATRQWRALIAARQALVGRRLAVQNRIRAILVGQDLAAPRGAKAWTELGLEGIAQHAKPLAEGGPDELWRGLLELALTELRQVRQLADQAEARLDQLARQSADVQLLETVPGVGPRTAEAIVAYLHEPGRFDSGKQVSAYVGLVPQQYQSGELDRRGRITRRGPALLRKLLVECAWCMIRYNAWARGIYQRLTGGGRRRKKQAIVALARKILVRCWAMLRDRKPWHDPQTGPKATLSPSKQRRQAEARRRRQEKPTVLMATTQ